MKAETIKTPAKYFIDEYGIDHIPMVISLGDWVSMFELIKEYAEYYAKDQIEKDRERIIESTPLIERIKLIETYNNTPIILD